MSKHKDKPEDIIKLLDPSKDRDPTYTEHYFSKRLNGVSMGCAAPKPTCPACEAEEKERLIKRGKDMHIERGIGPVSPQATTPDCINYDFSHLEMRILASLGVPKEMFDLYNKGLISKKTLLTHDCMSVDVEASDEASRRLVGIDYGDDGRMVMMTGVVKRSGEPNKNGDVFILDEPKYVGKFPVHRDAQPVNKTAARIKALTDQYAETVKNDPHHVPQTPHGMPFIKEIIKTQMQLDILEKSFYPMYALHVPSDLTPEQRREIRAYFEKLKKDPASAPVIPAGVTIEPVETIDQKVQRHPAVANLILAQDHAATRYKDAEARANHHEMSVWGERIHHLYRERQRVEARVFQEMRADMDEQKFRRRFFEDALPKEEAYDPPPSHRPECIRSEEFNIEDLECVECPHLQECAFHACNKPKCPKCDCAMVIRQIKHGPMEGDHFWGCSNFPDCQGARTHNEVLNIFTGLHSIDIEERDSGYVGFEAYDKLRQVLIYGRSLKTNKLSGQLLYDEFIEPCTRAFNITSGEVLKALIEELGLPWEDRYVGRDGVNIKALSLALRRSPTMAEIAGTKAHDEKNLYRITFETKDDQLNYLELRAKSRSGQTICGVKFTPDEPGITNTQVRDYLITPLVLRINESCGPYTDLTILQLIAAGLSAHPHPRARFVQQVVDDLIHTWNPCIHPAVSDDCVKRSVSELSKEHPFTPIGTKTGRIQGKKFNEAIKGHSLRNLWNPPPPQSCASDAAAAALEHVHIQGQVLSTAALLDRSYSQGTEDFIKRQQAERPRKLVEAEVARHEEAIKEEKMAEATKRFTPSHCKKCGHDGGCMCPREEEQTLQKTCTHPFLVLISHDIARELGVRGHALEGDTKIYACRECHAPFAPFEMSGGIKYIPAK